MSLRHAPRTLAPSSPTPSTAGAAVQLRRAVAAGAPERPLQYKGGGAASVGSAHAAAAEGIKGSGGKLPHGDAIQKSFGHHDVSHVQAHVGGDAAKANEQLGAQAYASGDHVAFEGGPDLHTAAHEAAHVVQQKAGVSLKGGIGESGDKYEQHADQVADAVVQGKSAEPILDTMAGSGAGSGGARSAVQRKDGDAPTPAGRAGSSPGAPPDAASVASEARRAVDANFDPRVIPDWSGDYARRSAEYAAQAEKVKADQKAVSEQLNTGTIFENPHLESVLSHHGPLLQELKTGETGAPDGLHRLTSARSLTDLALRAFHIANQTMVAQGSAKVIPVGDQGADGTGRQQTEIDQLAVARDVSTAERARCAANETTGAASAESTTKTNLSVALAAYANKADELEAARLEACPYLQRAERDVIMAERQRGKDAMEDVNKTIELVTNATDIAETLTLAGLSGGAALTTLANKAMDGKGVSVRDPNAMADEPEDEDVRVAKVDMEEFVGLADGVVDVSMRVLLSEKIAGAQAIIDTAETALAAHDAVVDAREYKGVMQGLARKAEGLDGALDAVEVASSKLVQDWYAAGAGIDKTNINHKHRGFEREAASGPMQYRGMLEDTEEKSNHAVAAWQKVASHADTMAATDGRINTLVEKLPDRGLERAAAHEWRDKKRRSEGVIADLTSKSASRKAAMAKFKRLAVNGNTCR